MKIELIIARLAFSYHQHKFKNTPFTPLGLDMLFINVFYKPFAPLGLFVGWVEP